MSITAVLAEDRGGMIAYRPRLNAITGSVTATILLQQIIYRWRAHGRQPFYKFNEPCEHHLYQPGDSWTEELGFSRHQLFSARGEIAEKATPTTWEEAMGAGPEGPLVVYWTDRDRVTYYALNEPRVEAELVALYGAGEEKEGGGWNYVNPESGFRKIGKADLSGKIRKADLSAIQREDHLQRDIESQEALPKSTLEEKNGQEEEVPAYWQLPPELQDKAFILAWSKWLEHLNGKGVKSFTGPQLELLWERLVAMGPDRAAAAIYHSAESGWKSIHEKKEWGGPQKKNGDHDHSGHQEIAVSSAEEADSINAKRLTDRLASLAAGSA